MEHGHADQNRVLVAQRVGEDGQLEVEKQVRVGHLGDLGLARRSRGMRQDGQVVAGGSRMRRRRQPLVRQGGELLAGDEVFDDALLDGRWGTVVVKYDAGSRGADHVGGLALSQPGADCGHHAAGQVRRPVGQEELRRVPHVDGDPVALPHPEAPDERPGQRAGPGVELRVAPGAAPRADPDPAREAPDALAPDVGQAADSRRGHERLLTASPGRISLPGGFASRPKALAAGWCMH